MINDDAKSTVEFLFPGRLRASPVDISRIVLLGSCMAQERYSLRFAELNPGLAIDFILYNHPSDINLDESTLAKVDLQYLQIPLRSVLSDAVIRFQDFASDEQNGQIREHAFHVLELMFDGAMKYTRSANLLTIVTTFIVPQMSIAPSLKEVGTAKDLTILVKELNLHLAKLVAAEANCYLADIDAIAASLGKAYILDDWFHLFAHNTSFPGNWTEGTGHPTYLGSQLPAVKEFRPSIDRDFYTAMWRQIEGIHRTVRQADQVKLVVFDLDNTLSRGLIAENYGADPATRAYNMGWPEGLREAIHHLKARGIMVAVCSKNDESLVAKLWGEAHPGGALRLDDFIIRKIGWEPKEVALGEIMAQLSLTEKSVVFVDDNPLEREAIKAMYPRIRVIGENQMLTKTSLLWAAETQVVARTKETLRREQMMQSQLVREASRAKLSRSDFIKSLECAVSLFRVVPNDENFGRCLELINKTNQFNTTGRRWTQRELVDFMNDDGAIFAFRATDKFADYGLIGVVLYQRGTFVQFVMSCRIIGLGVEESVLNLIMASLTPAGGSFAAQVQPTEANAVCRDIYTRCGFTQDSDTPTHFHRTPADIAPPSTSLTVDTQGLGLSDMAVVA